MILLFWHLVLAVDLPNSTMGFPYPMLGDVCIFPLVIYVAEQNVTQE